MTELLSKWESAVKDCKNCSELTDKANKIEHDYREWDGRRTKAIAYVVNIGDLTNEIVLQGPLENLLTLLQVSKTWNEAAERALNERYIHREKVHWFHLLRDIKSSSESERPFLLRFLDKHWPKYAEGLKSGQLILARNLFKEFLSSREWYPSYLHYIPGHFDIWHALIELGVLVKTTFTIEAYFYEDADTISQYGHQSLGPGDIKMLLESGNEKAISNFALAFPRTTFIKSCRFIQSA